MARLIDADALRERHCEGCNEDIREMCRVDPICASLQWVDEEPTVDAVEVVRCDNCVNHGNCLPEDVFRMARIENPYCCAGKVDGDWNG